MNFGGVSRTSGSRCSSAGHRSLGPIPEDSRLRDSPVLSVYGSACFIGQNGHPAQPLIARSSADLFEAPPRTLPIPGKLSQSQTTYAQLVYCAPRFAGSSIRPRKPPPLSDAAVASGPLPSARFSLPSGAISRWRDRSDEPNEFLDSVITAFNARL